MSSARPALARHHAINTGLGASAPVAASSVDELRELLGRVLRLDKRVATLGVDTRLAGSMPELDSMAVINVVVAIEDHFGFTFDEEELTEEAFATVGTLAALVDSKRSG
jgi:acyl carrier protein